MKIFAFFSNKTQRSKYLPFTLSLTGSVSCLTRPVTTGALFMVQGLTSFLYGECSLFSCPFSCLILLGNSRISTFLVWLVIIGKDSLYKVSKLVWKGACFLFFLVLSKVLGGKRSLNEGPIFNEGLKSSLAKEFGMALALLKTCNESMFSTDPEWNWKFWDFSENLVWNGST